MYKNAEFIKRQREIHLRTSRGSKTHKGLKRVTCVQCSWIFIFLSTIFGNPRCSLKNTICTCIALFCTFLCRHRKTTTWKCLFSRFVEGQKTRQRLSFSFSELRCNHMRVTRFCAVWKGKEKPWGRKDCRSPTGPLLEPLKVIKNTFYTKYSLFVHWKFFFLHIFYISFIFSIYFILQPIYIILQIWRYYSYIILNWKFTCTCLKSTH